MNKKIIAGNIYNKYETKNPIERHLVNQYLRTFDRITKKLQFNSVLEIGCGEGYLIGRLKVNKPAIKAHGIDISGDIIKQAKNKYKNVSFDVGTAHSLPYPDNRFDLAIACELLEHVEDPITAIKEIKRVSKKTILISIPNEPAWRIANIFRLKYLRYLGNTPGHINYWGYSSFRTFLERIDVTIKVSLKPFPWLMFLCEVEKN